ncbi:hypothetical protein ACFQU7_13410 [Pseudoroseomonas wenyumeiae]
MLLRGVAVLLAVLLHGAVLGALWPRGRPPPLVVEAVPVTLTGASGEAEEGVGAPPAPSAPLRESPRRSPRRRACRRNPRRSPSHRPRRQLWPSLPRPRPCHPCRRPRLNCRCLCPRPLRRRRRWLRPQRLPSHRARPCRQPRCRCRCRSRWRRGRYGWGRGWR